jgi:hypothetical protein
VALRYCLELEQDGFQIFVPIETTSLVLMSLPINYSIILLIFALSNLLFVRKIFNPLQPSGHYMYRTVVTICTAERSLYVPQSGHYMYRTAVTICTAQWSLYVPHSGHYMYRTVVTIYTASLTLNNSTFCPHSVFMCFVWISEQRAIISMYSINWLVRITETQCVYCAVWLHNFHMAS